MQLRNSLSSKLYYKKLIKPFFIHDLDYAAVSILIFEDNEILFIKRSNNLPTHKGHIAFPGGKREKKDDSVVGTALRETSEELLISQSLVSPFGYLDTIDTVEYKFNVFPILCNLKVKPSSFNEKEVQNIFYIPIEDLINIKKWQFRGLYSEDWVFKIEDEILWGATAKITRSLFNLDLT